MFDLTSASGRAILLSRYIELDVEFLGLQVPRFKFLDYLESQQGIRPLSIKLDCVE